MYVKKAYFGKQRARPAYTLTVGGQIKLIHEKNN